MDKRELNINGKEYSVYYHQNCKGNMSKVKCPECGHTEKSHEIEVRIVEIYDAETMIATSSRIIAKKALEMIMEHYSVCKCCVELGWIDAGLEDWAR